MLEQNIRIICCQYFVNTEMSVVGTLGSCQRSLQREGSLQEVTVICMVDRNFLYQGLMLCFSILLIFEKTIFLHQIYLQLMFWLFYHNYSAL